jgi:hypothetical protein
MRDQERFARRHHSTLTLALGLELNLPPWYSTFLYLFLHVDVSAMCAAIPGLDGAPDPPWGANLGQLV